MIAVHWVSRLARERACSWASSPSHVMDSNDLLIASPRAVHMHPEELVEHYDETRQQVRHLHNDIYYRPMLPMACSWASSPSHVMDSNDLLSASPRYRELDSTWHRRCAYDAILDAALRWSIAAQMREDNVQEAPAAIAIIAMGRYGGRVRARSG